MLEGELSMDWGVWLSYSSANKNQAVYGKNLIKIVQLSTWEDFGYFWTQSPIADPSNFFTDPNTGKYHKYDIEEIPRKIESVNFFKANIQPTWEFGDNKKGGYFNFSIPKDSQESQRIYQAIVYMAVGNVLSLSERITGVRLVDTAAKNQYRCRVEIWVDFKECQENLQLLKQYGQQLEGYFNQTKIGIKQIRFFNIDIENKVKTINSNASKKEIVSSRKEDTAQK